MLGRVLVWSGLIIGAVSYPALLGPEGFSWTGLAPSSSSQEMVISNVESLPTRGVVAIRRDDRGHFVGEFKLNGHRVAALVDTGATVIALNRSTARRAGLTLSSADFNTQVGTANGKVRAASVTLDMVEIGRIKVRDVKAVVLEDASLPSVLIGMSFLNQLDKFEVKGSELVLAN